MPLTCAWQLRKLPSTGFLWNTLFWEGKLGSLYGPDLLQPIGSRGTGTQCRPSKNGGDLGVEGPFFISRDWLDRRLPIRSTSELSENAPQSVVNNHSPNPEKDAPFIRIHWTHRDSN